MERKQEDQAPGPGSDHRGVPKITDSFSHDYIEFEKNI